jgi:hypothetical protein
MYYVETRADNSGYTNHRVTCLVVMGSPFDSEQVCWVSFPCYGYTNHRVICLVVIGSSFDSEQVFQVSNGYLW